MTVETIPKIGCVKILGPWFWPQALEYNGPPIKANFEAVSTSIQVPNKSIGIQDI